jgi:transposase
MTVKASTLVKLQQAALNSGCQLFYFDPSVFSASPPVQRGWSPIGEPHRVVPQPHCKRSVLGALDFGANLLTYRTSNATIKRADVVQFLDQIARENTPGLTKVVVLDNASILHNIDQQTIGRWFLEHRVMLFYLPPYSPELNLIAILWKHAKYRWRRFVTWTKETIDAEIGKLLDGFGSEFQINFS